MDRQDTLDDMGYTKNNRFSHMAFTAFIISLSSFVLFILMAVFNPLNDATGVLGLIFFLLFAISNIIGFILSIRSIIKKEKDTFRKTLGAIGNIVIFLILMGLLTFIFMDLFASFI